jgi:hypothetical protein
MGNGIRTTLFLLLTALAVPAADLAGIWAGQAPGRGGVKQDIAFELKVTGQQLSGRMFGDEFDLPLEAGQISGDLVRFTIVTTNYYSGTKSTFVYTGTVTNGELELTRERILSPVEKKPERENLKQTLKLRKLAS